MSTFVSDVQIYWTFVHIEIEVEQHYDFITSRFSIPFLKSCA